MTENPADRPQEQPDAPDAPPAAPPTQPSPYQAGYDAGFRAAQQSGGPTPGRPPYKRLTRATGAEAPISGVCGGLAKYLGIDPTLVRVLAAIAMVVTFPVGPIVYIVLWAVVPKE